jgi:murein DD-endopeptidase MepM/ murein hydrolase activator NlpD
MPGPQFPEEPIPDHLADTGPVQSIRNFERVQPPTPVWQRVFGLFSLLGATVLTIGAMLIMLSPAETPAPTPVLPVSTEDSVQNTTVAPTLPVDEVEDNRAGELVESFTVLPTLDPGQAVAMLNQPLTLINNPAADPFETVRDIYNPFTIIPNRTRSSVEQYTIESGDTIFAIAERYNLKPETIVWGNEGSIVEGLRPGRVINILPVDGVYHRVTEGDTVATIATNYQVDPYAIIDSEFNDLFGVEPEDALTEGLSIVVPGGQRAQIAWNPVVTRVEGGGGGSGGQGAISFAPGEAGSCGMVTNPGGTAWSRPIGNYQWVRGFSGLHSGVDLSAPVGSPVYAANGGSVIFAGWNSYGYGYLVALAHGPYTTLYAHLSSINVGCAQYVSAGQQIGGVGSSGQSSGPHLHFEIRYLDVPQDPTYTMPF